MDHSITPDMSSPLDDPGHNEEQHGQQQQQHTSQHNQQIQQQQDDHHQNHRQEHDQQYQQQYPQQSDQNQDQQQQNDNTHSSDGDSAGGNSARWRWNSERDLALIELVHYGSIWTVKYGQTTAAWNSICDDLASHPSAISQKSARPSSRTAQVRYFELLDKFRNTKNVALANNQLPVISNRLDELLQDIDEQTNVNGKAKATPQRLVKPFGYDDTDLTNDMSPNSYPSLSLSTGRIVHAKREEDYEPEYKSKRRRLEIINPFNLSQYQPALQYPPQSYTSHSTAESSQLNHLIAQNQRLIELHEANLRASEAREASRNEQEARQTRLLQDVQDEIRQVYNKVMMMMGDNTNNTSHSSNQLSSQMSNQLSSQLSSNMMGERDQ